VKSERSSGVLQSQLKPAIKKNRKLLLSGVCLQHDTAQTLTAPHSVKRIQDLTLEMLSHAQYSPDSAPQRFLPLLGPKRFSAWMSLHNTWGGEEDDT